MVFNFYIELFGARRKEDEGISLVPSQKVSLPDVLTPASNCEVTQLSGNTHKHNMFATISFIQIDRISGKKNRLHALKHYYFINVCMSTEIIFKNVILLDIK